MSADGQTTTHAQSSSSRRRSGRHLCLLGLRLLLAVSILTALAWAFRTYQRTLYATYGGYFLLAANAFCCIGLIRLVAKIALRWRELRPARFRYGALALLLAIGLLWSSLLAAELFSFWGRNVSVDTIVPRPSEL
jgi:hypothetical protein